MIRLLLLSLALLCLPACGNLKYIVNTYSKSKVQHHETPELAIRIFDRPDLHKMMVTPGIGRAMGMGMGAGSGATLGLWSPGMDPFPYQMASQDWLDKNQRNSTITSGKLLVKPQWEFTYADRKK